MYQQRVSARVEYLHEERERINASMSIGDKFQDLKSLSVLLAYFSPGGATRLSEIKYSVNLAFAKSVFRFDCPNSECVGGNFDLSADLARAVAERLETATGELRCRGWQSKHTIDRIHCDHVLRYELQLGY